MIITATSKDDLILSNLVSTLSQIKELGRPNAKLVIDYSISACDGLSLEGMTLQQFGSLTIEEFAGLMTEGSGAGPTCAVSFFTDEARSSLLFSEDSTSNSGNFSVVAGRTLYSPPDSLLNDADGVSSTKAQPIYWVKAEFCDGIVKKMTYRNSDNLVFPTVRVATKGEPAFAGAGSSLTIYPMGERVETRKVSESPDYIITKYELNLCLVVYNWEKLSEQERMREGIKANNLLRNALYADSSRGGHCTFWDAQIDGTSLSTLKVQPSKDMLKAVATVECCYVSSSTTY